MTRNQPGDPADGAVSAEDELSRYPGLAGKLKRLLAEADDETSAGRTLGDYRLLRRIGRGGMATVYEAEQISLRRRVAVKVLSSHLALSERAVAKFRREAEAASRQNHPGVVTVHALGEEDGLYYIVAELVEGGRTLADALAEAREAAELERGYFREVAERIAAVAEALEHVHASGVIHRDVKPSNILLTPEGVPRVTDFGLARVEDALALSRSGDFLGTPYYMSPEQVLGRREVDHRTDIFSLGVTLYECLTLERPFEGDTPQSVLNEIVVAEPRVPVGAASRVPRDLRVVCLKALDKDPRHRYRTMAELAEDLRRFLAGEAILARPASRARRAVRWLCRRRAWLLGGVAALVALGAVGGLWLELHHQQQRGRTEARSDYLYWKDATDWVTTRKGEEVATWIGESAPGSPAASWIRGLFAFLGEWELDEAAEHLERCLAECAAPHPGAIRVDASAEYLFFLVELSRAEAAADEGERRERLASAATHLARAGAFDPASRDVLVWRELHDVRIPQEGMRPACGRLKLRRAHPLVALFRGTRVWTELFTGGALEQFLGARLDFDAVLAEYPRNVPALSFRGRTEYFFARTYEFLGLLESARANVVLALEYGEPAPYFLDLVTKGQIDLLLGDPSAARLAFAEAIPLVEASESLAVHNTYRGLGQAFLGLGEVERAAEWFEKAAATQPRDPNLCVAMVDRWLWLGEAEKALEVAAPAAGHQAGSSTGQYTRNADVYLALARSHLALGDESAAFDALERLSQAADEHPRVFSRACLLLSTWPEPALAGDPRIGRLVQDLAGRAGRASSYDELASPVCLAAQGILRYLLASRRSSKASAYLEAIALLESAEAARRAEWHREIRAYYWPETARDLYHLAIVYAALAAEAPDAHPEAAARSRECYGQAERLREEGRAHPESRDLLERARAKARERLGESD